MNDKGTKMVSLRMPIPIYNYLKNKADKKFSNVSRIIIDILVDNYMEDSECHIEKED